MTVKILRPSLDDMGGNTVLRGIIDRSSISELKVDFYQRERMSAASRSDILNALEIGTQLPDVDLGMRGDKFELEDNTELNLLDPVFIIDGYQRISTLKDYVLKFPESRARIGAIIHFNTDPKWERERFHILNTSRSKVSPNILLRNMKEDVPLIATLYGLCSTDQDFCLHNRVTWRQTPGRTDLVSALTYLRITLRLHAHLVPARYVSTVDGVINTSNRLEDRLGLPIIRENAKTFWGLIDDIWGIKEHKIKSSIPYLQVQFLTVLVDIFADHVDFWSQPQESKLTIPYPLKVKLRKLQVYDPEIIRLSGASGKAHETLYFIIMSHINSGKRTKRLVPRNARAHIPLMSEDEDEEEENGETGEHGEPNAA